MGNTNNRVDIAFSCTLPQIATAEWSNSVEGVSNIYLKFATMMLTFYTHCGWCHVITVVVIIVFSRRSHIEYIYIE